MMRPSRPGGELFEPEVEEALFKHNLQEGIGEGAREEQGGGRISLDTTIQTHHGSQ